MGSTRGPVVAGMFYENEPERLKADLKELFSGIKTQNFPIVVSPHAGYVYSGRTAAFAVSSLSPAKKFIILGPNHSGLGPKFSVTSSGSWSTPLGNLDIDNGLAKRLKACGFLTEDAVAHSQEHSIEVQLPFLQHRFRDFSFVPVCIMNTVYSSSFLEECEDLGKTIASIVKGGDVGVVASSDFSHYLTQEIADKKDGAAMKRISELDLPGFFKTLEKEDASICGFGPIAAAMSAAKELGLKPRLINKTSSGDSTGDYGSVVSYYAIGFG